MDVIKNKLKSRYLQYGAYSSLFVVVILGVIAVVNYLSTRWFARIDLTEGNEYSITAATVNTLKKLDDIINFKVFFSSKLPSQILPTTKKVRDLLDEYRAYGKGNIRIKYFDPSKDPKIEQEARSLGLQPVRMDAIERDQRQIVTGYLGIVMQYEGRKELLPLVTEVQDLEYNLTRAIKKLVQEEEVQLGVLKGFGTVSLDTNCQRVQSELKNRYKLADVNLDQGQKIDTKLAALVVMSPENLSERAKFEIDQYVMQGGKLIAFVDGVAIKTDMGLRATARNHDMNDILGHYGARIGQNLVLDRFCETAGFTTQVGAGFFSQFFVPYPLWPKLAKNYINQENPVINKLPGVVLPWTSSVEITLDSADTSKSIEPLILARTTKNSWTQQGTFNLDPQSQFNAPSGLKKSHVMIAALKGTFSSYYKDRKQIPKFKKEIINADGSTSQVDTLNANDKNRETVKESPNTRILVMGNSQFATDRFVEQTRGLNANLFLNIIDWMAQDDDLITIRSRRIIDRPLKVTTPAKRSVIKWANVIIMPVLVIVFGLVRMVFRRKKMAGKESSKQREEVKTEGDKQ